MLYGLAWHTVQVEVSVPGTYPLPAGFRTIERLPVQEATNQVVRTEHGASPTTSAALGACHVVVIEHLNTSTRYKERDSMRKTIGTALGLILIVSILLTACGRADQNVVGEPTAEPAPTEVSRVCNGECQAPVMAAIDIVDSAGFHGMGGDLAAAAAIYQAAPPLGVMAAQDIIDGSGFHGMSEAIAEAETMEDISPRTVGTVEKALWVTMAAPYPTSLADSLAAFQADAEALIAALIDGDLEAAREASHAIHETQHSLSNGAFEYLAGQSEAGAEEALQVASVMAAQDIIDSSGFHGMSETIAEAASMEDISPRTVGSVEKALWASQASAYPEFLGEVRAAFQGDAESLIAALNDGDLEAAKEASEAIHGSQHELSEGAFAWLADQVGEPGEGLLPAMSVIAAQDIIDGSGFHGLSEMIAGAESMEDVNPRTVGTVEKALWVSRAASYPESISEALAAFQEDAQALIEALSAGDLDVAKSASHDIHETQHELSNQAFEYISGLDSNAMTASLINSRFLGTVENVYIAVASVDWPDDLAGAASAFTSDLAALAAALQANDVAVAAEVGGAVHGTQHDLSHDVYHWLGEQVAQTDQLEAIAAAIDIIDSGGFHGMSEEIAGAESMEDVSPRNLGRVENALAAARVVEWPESLHDAFAAFSSDAEDLASALENGDLELAKEASHAIHESQHGLSNGAYEYLAANPGAAASVAAVLVAQDAIDTAGFHGMAHDLEHATSMEEVNPRFLSTVLRVNTTAKLVAWPAELDSTAQAFIVDIEALAGALEAGDLAAAQEAAGAVHSSQHDLAHGTYAWIGSDVDFVAAAQPTQEPGEADGEEDGLPAEYSDAQVVKLLVDDWYWDPTTIELQMGVPVVLEITNEGALPHGIWVPQLNINVDAPAGETVLVPITPAETGTFTILCNNELCGSAEQHANMIAKIVVE